MVANYSGKRPSGLAGLLVPVVLFAVFGGVGLVGTLWATGLVEMPWVKKAIAAPNREGMVSIPLSTAVIPAYSSVTRDHLYNPEKAEFSFLWLRPEEDDPVLIHDMSKIIGRVLKREKRLGYAFTEADFYPRGTHAGITAGIPPGKRSFVFEAERVRGISDLRPGDHFDIVGSLPITEAPAASSSNTGNLLGADLVVSPASGPVEGKTKRAAVRPLVRDGVTLTAVATRQIPAAKGARAAQPKTVTEITIAIDPTEVSVLTEALAVDSSLTCVARTGQPTAEKEAELPVEPKKGAVAPKVRTIETLVNGKRQVIRFAENGTPIPDPPAEPMSPALPMPPANREQPR